MALPPRHFYKFNHDKSLHHFDMEADPNAWVEGAESYLNLHPTGNSFDLCTYSQVKKQYTLSSAGVKITKHDQNVEVDEAMAEFEDVSAETHRIEIEWEITDPVGHVEVQVDGVPARVSWSEGKIKDLNGVEAKLTSDFKIVEDLSPEEEERLISINRLERIISMTSNSELRQKLTFKVASLTYRGGK